MIPSQLDGTAPPCHCADPSLISSFSGVDLLMDSLAIVIPALIAIAAVFIGAGLQRLGTILSERRLLVGQLEGLAVAVMEYGDAVSALRDPQHRTLYENPSQEAIDYRMRAYSTNYRVREIMSALNGNCNSLGRKSGLVILAKAQDLEDAILEICKAMFDVNLVARHLPRGLPQVDPFSSQTVIDKLDMVDERVDATEQARKNLLEAAGNSYRVASFKRDRK